MKIRLWHILVFVVALAVFAVARAPAAFFLPQRPGQLTYAGATGTIWRGELQTVQLGHYHAQTASWRLSPLDLVQGKAIVPVSFGDGDIEGRMTLLANWDGDRRIAIQHMQLTGLTLRNMALAGETRINGLDILFEDGACVRAQGRVESDVLARAGQTLGWPGPSIVGAASCDGENARILLSGANDRGERVNARIVLQPNGAAVWRVSVQTEQPETIAALGAAGFTRGVADGLLGYGEETRWLP
jgi:hypothetical protein